MFVGCCAVSSERPFERTQSDGKTVLIEISRFMHHCREHVHLNIRLKLAMLHFNTVALVGRSQRRLFLINDSELQEKIMVQVVHSPVNMLPYPAHLARHTRLCQLQTQRHGIIQDRKSIFDVPGAATQSLSWVHCANVVEYQVFDAGVVHDKKTNRERATTYTSL